MPPADGNAKDDTGPAEAGTAEAGTAEPAYAPRSPEEQHLRDHTRYLVPSWPVSAFGVLGLLLGLVVNLVLVGACLWIGGRLLGVLLRASGILSGLGTEDPRLQLTYAGLGCAVLAGAGILVSWWAYLRDRVPAGGMGRQQRPRALTVSWRLLATATVGALLLVATPAAVAGLYHLGRCEGGDLATVVRWLGFGNHVGCPGVAAGPGTGASLAGNVAGMAAVLTALVGVIRTAVGKVRTYQKDLADQSWLTKGLSAGGRFVRDRLAPWAGTALVVVLAVYFGLRLVASAAASGPDWWWQQPLLAGFAFLVIVLVKALVDINHTSLHRYYRDRLAAAYAFDRTRAGTDVDRARLSELTKATPELVICAAANCTDREQKNVPPGRGAVSFTFTPTSVGLSVSPQVDAPEITPVTGTATGGGRTRRVRTESYEDCVPGFGLFDAVAVSGAAVAPVMGKMTQPTKRILFALGNVRLGVWLPSPHLVAGLDAPRSDERRKARRAVRRRLLQPDLQRCGPRRPGRCTSTASGCT